MARKKDSGPRCVWTDADDAALIRKLRDCKDIGMQSDSGWKPQVWHLCAEALKGSAGGIKTAEKIADHYTNVSPLSSSQIRDHTDLVKLKSAFVTVSKLREQSGFGWDDGLKMVTASDEVWEAYIMVGACTIISIYSSSHNVCSVPPQGPQVEDDPVPSV